MIELLELKFSRRWQTNKIESDWSNSPRHSSLRQFRSPSHDLCFSTCIAPSLDGISLSIFLIHQLAVTGATDWRLIVNILVRLLHSWELWSRIRKWRQCFLSRSLSKPEQVIDREIFPLFFFTFLNMCEVYLHIAIWPYDFFTWIM